MTHRAELFDVLERHVAQWPADDGMAGRIRALAEQHRDCFERSCVPGHITASAWIVSHDHTRCLLTHHRKLGRWLQLGGHADGATSPRAVALQEAREESGLVTFDVVPFGVAETIDLDVHVIPARGAEPEHEHHDVRYLLVATNDAEHVEVSAESHDVRWFGWDELPLDVDDSVVRMRDRARGALLG